MPPGISTKYVQMPFDDLSSTQELSFSPSPVPQADIVWEMPAPSNPALRTLMDNAKKDIRRSNPSPSDSNWAFTDPIVSSTTTASNSTSRPSIRSAGSRPQSSRELEANKALAELTGFGYMMSVAKVANQRAAERSKQLGGPVSIVGKAARKVRTEKSKSSKAVKSGKIQKRAHIKGNVKCKEKAKEDMDSAPSSALRRPDLVDESFATTSSLSATVNESMSIDTSFISDVSMHTDTSIILPEAPDHPGASVPSPHIPQLPKKTFSPTQQENTSAMMTKEYMTNVQGYPLLASSGEPLQPMHGRQSFQKCRTHCGSAVPSKLPRDAPFSAPTATPSSSLPRSSNKPPVLGMRRTVTLPAKNSNGTSSLKLADRNLPTKQRPFRTPFLSSTQQSGGTQKQAFDTLSTGPFEQAKTALRLSRDDGEFVDGAEEAETSYEYDSFDMDALEETLRKYD
ncbi:hypothetical protein GYMLUDRAFT_74147 [Collybiopsis luxurians FD-317 M1]|uniref:Uncharacterized protein n=1 Tax=Collybiopsis luxurians FD-317 M1 TaxID=944289 RepID=A0A0D0BVX1_9AGAR|nr:hypothetical protein GYMLUDRAFT_74147 [Collybiopsis luxurians FD-317 M1]